jgi:NTE family protein
MGSPDHLHDHIKALLHSVAPPSMKDPGVLEALAAATRWFSVPGGETLFRRGDPADALYFVVSGVLGVIRRAPTGPETIITRLGPGEVVGEMGCVTGQPRTATVRALRSTELLAISWDELERISATVPDVLRSVCTTAIQRFIQTQEGRPSRFQPRTFAVISGGDGVDLRAVGEQFTASLKTDGRAVLATREEFQNLTADQLFQIEDQQDYLVYVCDPGNRPWTSFCLRQSDTVLAVVRGDTPPRALPEIAGPVNTGIPVVLILTWPANRRPSGTADWLASTGLSRHFHVRGPADMNRVRRLLTGRGLGLALSGGGARGLAHVGVVRAMRERGIEIDVVTGTSVGSLIGAGVSGEYSVERMTEEVRQFAKGTLWFEITVPKVSLLAGRNLRRLLARCFHDDLIEDAPIPFACVSTNLTAGGAAIHRTGPLRTWVGASMAVPGVFPPTILGDTVYVDGGMLNNLPADLIREDGASFVIGVDVAGNALAQDLAMLNAPRIDPGPTNIFDVLWRTCCIVDDSQSLARRRQCDMLIVPRLQNVGLLNFRAFESIIEAGYQSALKMLDDFDKRRANGPETRQGDPL